MVQAFDLRPLIILCTKALIVTLLWVRIKKRRKKVVVFVANYNKSIRTFALQFS